MYSSPAHGETAEGKGGGSIPPFLGPWGFCLGSFDKRARFFGVDVELNLVYIYDAIGFDRPAPVKLTPGNLILGPSVVNNLGFSRGYWEIVASEPVLPNDTLDRHLFVRFRGTGSRYDYDLVNEAGKKLDIPHLETDMSLGQSGIGNYNQIDWNLQEILRERGVLVS